MSYYLDRFGDAYATAAVFPGAGWMQDANTDQPEAGTVRVLGGALFDAHGAGRAPLAWQPISLTCIAVADDEPALGSLLDGWRALIGTRSNLWAVAKADGSLRWRLARLTGLRSTLGIDNERHGEVSFVFEPLTGWRAQTATTTNSALDASPKTVTVANGGNLRVDDAVVTVTASGSPITALTVAISGVSEITWTGTLAVGQSLVIDCGTQSVLNNGVAAYSALSRTANHKVPELLRLEPGNNAVVVTRTGGDNASTISIAHYGGWA